MSAGTVLLYRDDPYLLEFEAAVVARREHEGRPAVVLDRTAFYAESGGQPWDTGSLGGSRVLAVIKAGEDVLHVLDAYPASDRVQGRVDAERRRDHRQQHHGQHLLSRAFVEVAGAETVSFHLGAVTCSIDLDRAVGDDPVAAAERRANEVVWEARPVTVRTMSRGEAMAQGIAVPPEADQAAVRIVEAAGFDRQPCGGTHPRSTAEVGVVLVLSHEKYKGGTRVHFACGFRALAHARTRGALLERAGVALSAAADALPDAAQRLKDQLAEEQARGQELLRRAIEGEARRLLAARAPGDPVLAVYEGWPPADLRALAQRLVALDRCVALLGSVDGKAHAVFAQSEGLPFDVGALLRDAMQAIGGRGGGRGNLAQGGGERADGLRAALEGAAGRVREQAAR